MAVYHGMAQFAPAQRARFAHAARSVTSAHAQLAQDMLEEARELSSDTSLIAVIDRTHPFSRRRPGGVPRLPIQTRSGRLLRGWRVFRYSRGGRSEHRLQNVAPHSRFVLAPGGTRVMVARGFWSRMHQIYARRRRAIETAAARAVGS